MDIDDGHKQCHGSITHPIYSSLTSIFNVGPKTCLVIGTDFESFLGPTYQPPMATIKRLVGHLVEENGKEKKHRVILVRVFIYYYGNYIRYRDIKETW